MSPSRGLNRLSEIADLRKRFGDNRVFTKLALFLDNEQVREFRTFCEEHARLFETDDAEAPVGAGVGSFGMLGEPALESDPKSRGRVAAALEDVCPCGARRGEAHDPVGHPDLSNAVVEHANRLSFRVYRKGAEPSAGAETGLTLTEAELLRQKFYSQTGAWEYNVESELPWDYTPLAFETRHLTGLARRVAEAVVRHLSNALGEEPGSGGCRAFYSPEEWLERGEKYGSSGVLVLVHDGGDLAPFCNWDYMDHAAVESLRQALVPFGVYIEQCTTWYSAVYKV